MFLFLLVFIMVCCFFEKNGRNWAFHAAWLVLTAVLCIRFAQGRDYRTYWMMYHYGDGHSEFLWRCITTILNNAGVPFEAFIFGISLFMMYGIRRAVLRFSPYHCFSLLLLYPTIYFSYFFSALWAGILIIAANEGNCVALAAGKIPAVYMQNSGEGNLINPAASFKEHVIYDSGIWKKGTGDAKGEHEPDCCSIWECGTFWRISKGFLYDRPGNEYRKNDRIF